MKRMALLGAAVALPLMSCMREPAREADSAAAQEFVSDRISVVTRGTGPDIILIPGLASHRDVWAAVGDTLDNRYRLHLVQVNGFAGDAPGANANGDVAAPVTEEIARYVRETDLEQPAVIGHSMGGTIGLMLAARHPGSVGRLMVVDMTPYMGVMFGPSASTPEGLRAIAGQTRDTILAQPVGSGTSMLEQMFSGMTRVPTMRSALLQYVRDSHRPTVANAMREIIATDMRPELTRINVPVRVLYVYPSNLPISSAEFDAGVRQSWSGLSGVQLVKIDDSNHFIQVDQPARFVTEVEAFMRR